ncbi:MAG: fructose-1,6-bisphosphatase, partial [Gammaproteobacteria bacterium]|nr:fructose-1,6-bisphosphatase [Gammaproteobacteria bacterium]
MRGESLTQFIIHEQRKNPTASGEFTLLLNDIAAACKAIGHEVNRGALAGNLGLAGTQNVQGEAQKKLDVIANELFLRSLEWTGHFAAMASEENDEVIPIPPPLPRGKYLVCFDPLDGSSNIDLNLSVGTIFSVLRCPESVGAATEQSFLQPGTAQVSAGFCIYGPTTIMVLTTGNGVNGFTLDR